MIILNKRNKNEQERNKTVEGSVISAWSSHGIVSKEFTIYI